MTKITYVQPDGTSRTVDVAPGISVMKAAVRNDIPGIDGDCGGSCVCGTCHVYVDEAWPDKAIPLSLAEETLLGFVKDARPNSRLCCQIIISSRIDGLIVHIPEQQ